MTTVVDTASPCPVDRTPHISVGGYAATVRAIAAVIGVFNTEITRLQGQVAEHFGRHPDAEIYRSQPGLGDVLGARVLGEFGDDPHRYAGARARNNYAGTSPITRASGKKKTVHARWVRNRRMIDPLQYQAFSALTASPAHGPTTGNYAPGASAITPRCASCPTGWSESSTAASRLEPSTTKPPPGPTNRINQPLSLGQPRRAIELIAQRSNRACRAVPAVPEGDPDAARHLRSRWTRRARSRSPNPSGRRDPGETTLRCRPKLQ